MRNVKSITKTLNVRPQNRNKDGETNRQTVKQTYCLPCFKVRNIKGITKTLYVRPQQEVRGTKERKKDGETSRQTDKQTNKQSAYLASR